jgi:hypothetical protein
MLLYGSVALKITLLYYLKLIVRMLAVMLICIGMIMFIVTLIVGLTA